MTPAVFVSVILGILAVLSLALNAWQWLLAARFPLHQRGPEPEPAARGHAAQTAQRL